MVIRNSFVHTIAAALCLAMCFTACSRDPNARKQRYMESGRKYYDAGKYHEAGIQFSNALQIDARDPDAHYQMAQTLIKLQSWNNAYRELARTVDLQPNHYQAQLDMGTMLLASRQPKPAREKAELVLQKQPNNPDAHMLLAGCDDAENDHEKAIAEAQKAIELAPGRAPLYLGLAFFQSNGKQFDDAEKSYQKAMQLDPSSLPAIEALAKFYESQQKWPEAEKLLNRATMVAPKDVSARVELARLYQATNRNGEAEKLLSDSKNALSDDPNGYRLLADYYMGTGQMDKAIAEFATLHDKHPKDLALAKSYARLLAATDHYEVAQRIDEDILKINPRDGDAIILKGQILTRQGHADQAVKVLEGAMKNDADNPLLHFYFGNALAAVGDTDRANTEWLEAVKLNPNSMEAQKAVAEAAARRNDLGNLESAANAILKLAPTSPDGYIYRAIVEAGHKEYPKAEQDLQQAVAVAPNNPAPYVRLGTWRMSQGKQAEALKAYEKALELDATNTEALQGLSLAYAHEKQYPQLVARLQQQVAKAPNSSSLYQFLGAALMETKDTAGASAAFQKAFDLDNSNSTALLALAQSELSRGAVDKAAAALDQDIQKNPKDVRPYLILGSLYEGQGNWQKAEEVYKRALDVQPQQPMAANALAYLMLEHGGNVDVALSMAQAARQARPDLTMIADTLAWAYYQRGAYSSAISLLEEALKKDPNDATAQYHLGLSYEKVNDKVRARQHLQRALQLNPSFAKADDARKALAALGA